MHQDLVEKKRWISERRYLHALNYCMLLPGPEAQQLAIYIGWLMHRTWGGILADGLFALPSLLILIGLGWFTWLSDICPLLPERSTASNRRSPPLSFSPLTGSAPGVKKLAVVDDGGANTL